MSGGILSSLTGSRRLSILFRLVLGGVFIYAGVPKIMEPSAFAEAISNYRFFPGTVVNPIALWLPWLPPVLRVLVVLLIENIGLYDVGLELYLKVVLFTAFDRSDFGNERSR